MAADKIPSIVESALSNANSRTRLHTILGPKATAPPHYHTLFSEKFTLLSGSLTVYTANDYSEASLKPKSLSIGESATVPIGTLHNFLAGEEGCTCSVEFAPGALSFERAMLIMRGTQKDGIYQEFGKPDESSMIFLAVLSELTDTHVVGHVKEMMDELYKSQKHEIEAKKKELLGKYATDEQLKNGVSDELA
jgi:mannose-6-phosphate isomerase-like protein (cupin superfamily)